MLPHVSMRRCFKSPVSRHFRRSLIVHLKTFLAFPLIVLHRILNRLLCAFAVPMDLDVRMKAVLLGAVFLIVSLVV